MFFDYFLVVAAQVLVLFLLIAIGFICKKAGLLTAEANRCISNILMYIITPCVIVNSFLTSVSGAPREYVLSLLRNIGVAFLVATASHVLMILAVSLIFHGEEKRRRVLRFGTVFSNCGFVSLPLVKVLIDDVTGTAEGTLYVAVYIGVFNILVWTWGLLTMSGERTFQPRKLYLNPGLIGVTVGLLLLLPPLLGASFAVPAPVANTLTHLSNVNVPLPMFLIGYYLAEADLKDAFRDLSAYLCMALRLIFIPLVAIGAFWLLGLRGNLPIAMLTCLCAPVGAVTTIFSNKFESDIPLSVRLVALSTLLSMLTMPPVISLAQIVIG